MHYLRQPSTAPCYAAFALILSLLSACGGSDSGSSTSSISNTSGTSTSSGGSSSTSDSSGTAGGAVTLNWQAPTENTNGTAASQLIGFYIYYGTSADNLDQWVVAWGSETTSFTVTNLASGTYYFAIAAYNWMGVESTPTGVVSATI
jgi:hypothetical protein